MGKPLLYSLQLSPPVRAVQLTAKVIGLELDIQEVDYAKQEHLSEKFLKINPQHTVPVLDDNGDIIWDSHAICTYIIEKYAKNDSLYPKDLVQRARVDQRLHFDSGVLFASLRNANVGIYNGGTEVGENEIAAIHTALQLLEDFLKDSDYLVGNSLTFADICILTTVKAFEMQFPLNKLKYAKIAGWIERLSSKLPLYKELVVEPNVGLIKWFVEKKAANAAAATK